MSNITNDLAAIGLQPTEFAPGEATVTTNPQTGGVIVNVTPQLSQQAIIGGTASSDIVNLSATDLGAAAFTGQGDDTVTGGAGNSVVDLGAGSDVFLGGDGNEFAQGGDGGDTMSGGAGNDNQNGNRGGDELDAGTGSDVADGGKGDDTVDGGAGDDFISGSRGNDSLTGGIGADTFFFFFDGDGDNSYGVDTLTDFNSGEDKIGLQVSGTTGVTFSSISGNPGDVLSADQFAVTSNFSDAAGITEAIIYDPTDGSIYYNPTAAGANDAVKIAELTNTPPTLDASDFEIF